VLLDVMMPDMNGYEVFAELQTSAQTAGIPVIFVTAKNDPQSETSALNAGAVDFIHKPINPTVVKARVKMHLSHQAREREVRQLNTELEQRVQERTQALKDALLKIETALQVKANLLANMSHEFRTPLNIVLGISHLVAKRIPDPQVQSQMEKIALSGKNLLSLLNDILDMSRLEANKFQIETMDFDLQTVVDACLGLVSERARNKGLTLEVQIDQAVPADLYGDPLRLGQILANLMSNAIKFSAHTPEGGAWPADRAAVRGGGPRRRHSRRRSGPHLRTLRARRRINRPGLWWRGHRIDDMQIPHATDEGHRWRGQSVRTRQYVLG
jgi:signal transduction histidine kinase